MRLDFHVHTVFSFDSGIELRELINVILDKGLTGVAICDHNTVEGAKELRKIAPFLVIVGEEIKTIEGELIGYFLESAVPPALTPEETVERIKGQGGLVCLPHPFDRFRRSCLSQMAIERIKNEIDFVEGYNSRNILKEDNLRAQRWAKENNKLIIAGSDAHTYYEVGRAYTDLPDFSRSEQLKEALKNACIYGTKSSCWVHAYSIAKKSLRRISVGRS